MNSPRLSLDDHLCFSIYATSIAINRLYKPILDNLEITYPQYLVLTALRDQGKLSISELAESLDLNSSTITPLVKRLEKSGLLIRQRNSQNERQVMVELSTKGRDIQEKAQCLGEKLAYKSGMTNDQLSELHHLILKLKDSISLAD